MPPAAMSDMTDRIAFAKRKLIRQWIVRTVGSAVLLTAVVVAWPRVWWIVPIWF